MSWKPTIFAFILAVIAVVAALLTGGDRIGDRASARGETRPLLAPGELPVDDVMRITLVRRDQPAFVFERGEEGRWQQIEPFEHPLDRFALRRLITAATEVEVTDVLDGLPALKAFSERDGQPWSMSDLGLNPPEATIVYEWNDDFLSLDLGRRTIAGRAYLRRSGERYISVVNQSLHRQAVELDPREWRDRTIFPDVGIESDRIIRTVGTTRLVIERDRRQWRIIEPIQSRVDPQRRDQLIHSLAAARGGGFITDQPRELSRFGLDPPVATIEVVTEATGSQHRLLIGSTAGAGTQDRFGLVEGRPTIIRIPARVWQLLFDHPADLADPTGSGTIAADIKTVRIIGPVGDFRIQRDMERWRAIDHGGVDVPRDLMDEFLSLLTELRADDVILQEYPHELEVAVITFYGFDDRPRDTVRILRDPETSNWALENGDNVLRVFSEQIPMRLSPTDFGLPEP